ncbi:MAG: hypothetical protein DDT42_01301 [candidate division WS2 bacterium]|uniref:Uncharacterized protein n=1 Tax=Psychracetigena formicireducens TaxID=2986056 RepID=A0A9E2BH25_PSYF1|nr:hypothetical protein [Candidatus Psychracetigena formicireducens]
MKQMKIDIIDNGYILSYVDSAVLREAPQAVVKYFADIDQLYTYLKKELRM